MEGVVHLLEEAVRGGEVGQQGCKGKCWLQHYLHTYIPVVSGTVMVDIMDGAPLVGGDAICVGVWPCGFSSLMCLPRRRDAPIARIGSERFDWIVKSLKLTKEK